MGGIILLIGLPVKAWWSAPCKLGGAHIKASQPKFVEPAKPAATTATATTAAEAASFTGYT